MSAPRTALVTGSTDGIGKATALALARAGLRVVIHGRNRPKVEHAVAELTAAAPEAQFLGVSFDLGSFSTVRRGAKELAGQLDRLDVLICNAGIFANERVVVADGLEATLAVNHVGHVLLTELLGSYGLVEPALATLARECYRLLGLQSYFTAGEKEIRAWTVRKGALGPEAAGVIHTDFEKGYIRAQVYSLADLEQYGSEAALKAAGKMRQEGKAYEVQDGDIMHFLFNV